MKIHERIKKRRQELGLSADYVANQIGVSRATYYRYESADIEKVSIDVIKPLSIVLNTTPSYLMGWEEEVDKIDKVLNEPKNNPDMQKRTLKSVKTYFNDEIHQVLDIMKDFDIDTQKELLKRAQELEVLKTHKNKP